MKSRDLSIKTIILFVLIILHFSTYLYSQTDVIKFQHITIEDGLSQNTITCILQDSKGFMWFGTQTGLNRYDGSPFTVYKNIPGNLNSLSDSYINALFEDHLGNIWIGTENGLNRFDYSENKFVCYQSDPKNPYSLSHNRVRSIYEDQSGCLWIGTENGLNRFDRSTQNFICYLNDSKNPTSLSHNRINSIYGNRSGRFWIGTENGLNRFEQTKNKFTCYYKIPGDSCSLGHNQVNSVYVDSHGELWIGTEGGGLTRFDHTKQCFIQYINNPKDPSSLSDNRITSIYDDHLGHVWIGTKNGLNKFDRKTKQFIHYSSNPADKNSMSSNYILTIYEDRSGSLWIGTYGGGLNRFDSVPIQFITYQVDPNNPNGLNNNDILSFCEEKENVLWIGTHGGGLNKLIPGPNEEPPPTFISYKHDPNNSDSISYDYVYSMCEDQMGTLWIGTYGGGLNKLVPSDDKGSPPTFKSYKNDFMDPYSLSNNHVMTVYEDRSGQFWIGTLGGGLNKFDREKEMFTHYTEEDGLPNNTIYGILEDEHGSLYLSTNNGLSRFDPKTEKFRIYDVSDGLQGNEFWGGAYYKSKNGEMFFGGVNGFNSFYPGRIKDNPHIPAVVITDFQIFNKSVPVGKMSDGRTILKESITETGEIELTYRDRAISFEFVALNYVSPEKNEYAYMMEGLDNDWNYIGNRRFASYTTLPPGNYIFRVKGSNNDGVWNEEGVSLRIKITPPFWKTWWFYILCALAIFMSGVGIFSVRVRQIKRHAKELQHLVDERTGELKNANRKLEELAIHDSLTGIYNHRRFSEFFELEWRRSVRMARPLSLILVDVDYFKLYNDVYGHQAGDECLKNVAQTLAGTVKRAGDMVARYGGEEFVIVLSETDIEGAGAVAEKARAKVEALGMTHEKSTIAKHVTVSLGCAGVIPKKDDDPSALIKAADDALYQAKEKGRNQVSIAET